MDDTFTLDVGQAVEIKHATQRNGGTNADLKVLCTGDMFAQILPILRGYGKVVVELLLGLGEVAFPGATNFVASAYFVKDTSETARVKISGFGSNFSIWFLGKTEANVAPSKIGYDKFLKRAKVAVILVFLGGEVLAETTLAEIHHLTTLQSKGEAGALLNNGWANLFFVRDKDHVLRVVDVYWHVGGWSFFASGVSGGRDWYDDDRVFTRKVA